MERLPDWMRETIDGSFTAQFTTYTAKGVPVALPVFLNHFDAATGELIFSSMTRTRRVANVRRNSRVAVLFSPTGRPGREPTHILLVQGDAEVDDADPEHVWEPYFAGWARRQPSARETLQKRAEMPEYWRRAVIRVRPVRLLGWRGGDLSRPPEVLEAGR